MQIGVIIGRFQVPELTEGHIELIKHVKKAHDQVLVFIGNSVGNPSAKNPLDYATREKMIRHEFPDILTLCLTDQPTDEAWSHILDQTVKAVFPHAKVVLYGGRDSFIPYYKGSFATVEIQLTASISGTQVREIAASKIQVSTDFRAGMIYALHNQFPRINPTVDIALINPATSTAPRSLLLGKKPNEDLLRFPGGFVDPIKDNSFEDAVIRECQEETGLTPIDPAYIGSICVADWRYPDRKDGCIFTSVFMCPAPFFKGTQKAGDDLASIGWYPLDHLKPSDLVSTHRPLLKMVQEKVGQL